MAALTATLREIDVRRESADAQPFLTQQTFELEPLPNDNTNPTAHELASAANKPRLSAHLPSTTTWKTNNRTRDSMDSPLLAHSRSSSGTVLSKKPPTPSEGESRAAYFLRTLGLEVFYSLCLVCRRRRPKEPKKEVISFLAKSALAGSHIHIIPVIAAIYIVCLNLKGYYIGADLAGAEGQNTAKLNAIQFAAKLHELTMHASLATIVFSVFRYELSCGKVLPFGAIFAGFQFKEISFLWSAEFWGFACSQKIEKRRKIFYLVVIITSTLLAVSVGPAAAIAMTPRVVDWPAGGTSLWINATSKNLWPDQLDSNSLPGSFCKSSDALECPSGDWTTIRDFMRVWNNSSRSVFPKKTPTFPNLWPFPCPHGYRQLDTYFRFGRYKGAHTIASMPHFVISGASAVVSTTWAVAARNVEGSWRYKYRSKASYEIKTEQAYVLVFCFMPTTIYLNQTTIGFPLLAENSPLIVSPSLKVYNSSEENSWFYDLSSSTAANADFRVKLFENSNMTLIWFSNPSDEAYVSAAIIGSSSAKPGAPIRNRSVLTCSVDSRWTNSTLHPWAGTIQGDNMHVQGSAAVPKHPKPVNITTEWLSALSPFIEKENDTVFNLIAAAAGLFKDAISDYRAEAILAAMVANGMSRLGFNATLQSTLVPNWMEEFMIGGQAYQAPAASNDWVSLQAKMIVNGYAYQLKGTTAKVACIILLIYSTVAIFFLAWSTLWVHMSSKAWSSIGEVTALAMNSKPSTVLKNTCAGILSIQIFGEPVRILETDGTAGISDHLELVFGTEDIGETNRPFQPNKLYG